MQTIVDLFPANLTTPTAEHRNVRLVVVEDQRAFAWTWNQKERRAEIVASGVGTASREGKVWTVALEDGQTWSAEKSGTCPCRLRAFQRWDWRASL